MSTRVFSILVLITILLGLAGCGAPAGTGTAGSTTPSSRRAGGHSSGLGGGERRRALACRWPG